MRLTPRDNYESRSLTPREARLTPWDDSIDPVDNPGLIEGPRLTPRYYGDNFAVESQADAMAHAVNNVGPAIAMQSYVEQLQLSFSRSWSKHL